MRAIHYAIDMMTTRYVGDIDAADTRDDAIDCQPPTPASLLLPATIAFAKNSLYAKVDAISATHYADVAR